VRRNREHSRTILIPSSIRDASLSRPKFLE
jgi:hypothetical protein